MCERVLGQRLSCMKDVLCYVMLCVRLLCVRLSWISRG